MQNLGGGSSIGPAPAVSGVGPSRNSVGTVDGDLLKLRHYMRSKIFNILLQGQSTPVDDASRAKYMDVARRLEEGLLKMAVTKEEYMNPQTLEARLTTLIKGRQLNNFNQRHANSSSVGTMIPTPGLPHGGGNANLMVTSSVDASAIGVGAHSNATTTAVSAGSLLPYSSMHGGNLSNGFEQSSTNFSVGPLGNMSSLGSRTNSGQMIPTPGFVNSNNNNNNKISNSNTQSYINMETSNNGSGFPAVDPASVTQQQQQRQHVGPQNSRILHNLGSQMGRGFRSGMQQKLAGVMNGSPNSGMGMNGTSEGFLSGPSFADSPRSIQQAFDNLQRSGIHGERLSAKNLQPFGSGDLYGAMASDASTTNAQNSNSTGLRSLPEIKPSLISNQSISQGMQQGNSMKHQSINQFDTMGFQPSRPFREHMLQSHHQQFQQQPHQFKQQQQYVHQQPQLKQENQQKQRLINNDAYGETHLVSDRATQVKQEPRLEQQNNVMQSQAAGQHQPSHLRNQYESNSAEQMPQMFHPQYPFSDSQADFSSLSAGTKSESGLQGQWLFQSQENTLTSRNMSNEQHILEGFSHRMPGIGEQQVNNFYSEGSSGGQGHALGETHGSLLSLKQVDSKFRSGNENRDPRYKNQQRWLLYLRHARFCKSPEGKCIDQHCVTVQKLWRHMDSCDLPQCSYPRCHPTKKLINHYKNCKDSQCPVCVPVKNYLQQQAKACYLARLKIDSSICESGRSNDSGQASAGTVYSAPSCADVAENLHPSLKRLKVEMSPEPVVTEIENSKNIVFLDSEKQLSRDVDMIDNQCNDGYLPVKPEASEVKAEGSAISVQGSYVIGQLKKDIPEYTPKRRLGSESVIHEEPACSPKQERVTVDKETGVPKKEILVQPSESMLGSKSGKPTVKGVSLTELFTPEQVREHIRGLRQWVGQSKTKVEKNQALGHSMSENSCQLCAVEKLTFEPPPIYCTPCGARIKRNAMYYTVGAGETRHYFCIPCYNESRGDAVVAEGTKIAKARLEKKKNDEETEEWWVQCDKCEAWQHQICALFNGRRNDGGQAEYTCPNCYIEEVERGERKPLPQSAVLGAKDLPTTILSDHIEKRLFGRLKQERLERARVQGKSYDEVPGAEALVVRVVSSVDKKLEVKPRFLEIFREENYPTEFPYKSKVVLLFQKIEGVEVCLFGMYVQEFGTECAFPNQRRVYLSYLDSVKYFRPEVKSVSGEALRTFVYHEILIGYLEYCKLRGFTSCYIWACPPLKGEDYILYCHPEIQKTPKSDKLREWYLSMLKKAAKERVVVECTNLYDHFFMQTGECKAKVTAARLPYFDGDYWPGAAEDLIHLMNQEEDGSKHNKKSFIKKTITKRALKASGQSDLSGNASKDLLLMHKLGETIHPMKEDFIMVHLQYCCTHCCALMASGNRWVCSQCKTFRICDKCYEAEQRREDRERHPTNLKEKHTLYPVEITEVPADTKDKDEILESEFFDTRQAFLSLCQGNHYQYDTLRRAKHSSMMVLYHLHNPTAPAFVTTCNACHLDIEAGQGWRCEICPDYDVCNACYSKEGGVNHPHKLTNHPSLADQNAQNKEARQLRVLQLRKMLDLLVHASQCRSPFCQYPNCRKVKGLFRHGIQCRVRASGGCVLCKKMWYLLQIHARACKESQCHVPRCKDLKDHLKRLQQQSDSRRRAAVMEMMRQRAAEVAGNSG